MHVAAIISCIMVTSTRAPLAPMAWPMATDPPLTLTFSRRARPSSRVTARACAAKASLNSKRSMLSMVQPALAMALRAPMTGAIMTHLGSMPLVAWATIRAMGRDRAREPLRRT
jgi:hypothetical protein